MKVIFLIAEMLFIIVGYSSGFNYCNITTCWHHTACIYEQKKVSLRCTGYRGSILAEGEKKVIVDLHNQLRQKVASGNEVRGNPGPQPKAKYMPDLVWDNELEMIAQMWADQCVWRHDTCRDVERFRVGQNLATQYYRAEQLDPIQIEALIMLWYDEVEYFNSHEVDSFRFAMHIGHYTQVVWAKTTHIGCGITDYREGYFLKFYLVCNYGPTGNYIGHPVYERA